MRSGKEVPFWNLDEPSRLAWEHIQLEIVAAEITRTGAAPLVGPALGFYLQHGILLADVHFGNLGEIVLPGSTKWELVITDPGHMVPLDKKWLHVKVPQLYG
jgi:hypothetical protein